LIFIDILDGYDFRFEHFSGNRYGVRAKPARQRYDSNTTSNYLLTKCRIGCYCGPSAQTPAGAGLSDRDAV
jgi:hypothetical protein